MSDTIYRPARPEDLDPITAIARRVWTMGMSKRLEDLYGQRGDKSWDEWTAQDIGGSVRASLDRCTVAEVDGQVAGWVTWSIN